MSKHGWKSANKTTFQRVLYFAAVLSSIFTSEAWTYNFSNTMFGPYNNDIVDELNDLFVKGFIKLEDRKTYSNRIEERFSINQKGIKLCEETFLKLNPLKSKILWFDIIVKTLSIYGEDFLSKLIKEEPNVYYQNKENKNSRLIIDESSDNLSKEFFSFIKCEGKSRLNIELKNDYDYLLLFFDVLYRKYKGAK